MKIFHYSTEFYSFIFKLFFCFFTFFNTSFAVSVNIPEPTLEIALAKSLQVDRGKLTSELIEKLEFFELNNAGLRDLSGLEFAKNLKVLILRDNLIEDLSPLSDLAHLEKLDLTGNNISDLSPFSGLSIKKMLDEVMIIRKKLSNHKTSKDEVASLVITLSEVVERIKRGPWQLKELSLAKNRLLGLSGISHLSELRHLNVSGNSLIDLEGVSILKKLITFYAHSNQLGRIESYVDENKNKMYDLGEPIGDESGNGKRDIDALIELQSLPKLENLYLYNNLLENISSLGDLPSLQILLLSGNKIQSIRNLGKFTKLKRLSLSDNRINSLVGLEDLSLIEHLYLVENRVCDLRPIEKLITMKELRLQRNQLIDVKALSGYTNIQVLSLSNNFIYSIKPLTELETIKRLSLSGNCLDLESEINQDHFSNLRSKRVLLNIGSQKKRIIEAEQLVFSMIGHPSSNAKLGNYLEQNGYLRLMDFVEDSTIDEEEKLSVYKTWRNALINGRFDTDMPFLEN